MFFISCFFTCCVSEAIDAVAEESHLSNLSLEGRWTRPAMFPLTISTNVTLHTGFGWSSSVSTLSTHQPLKTSTQTLPPGSISAYDASQCLASVTTWAYKTAACAAPDQESYTTTRRAHYSCFNRCGEKPNSGDVMGECGCDKTCELHGDCCEDFSLVCSGLYSSVSSDLSHMMTFLEPSCDRYSPGVIRRCKAYNPQARVPLFDTDATEINADFSQFHINMQILDVIMKTFSFQVIDTYLGVVFDNYDTFTNCKAHKATPYFVPKVNYLRCPYHTAEHLGKTSIKNTLSSCEMHSGDDAHTEFNRKCYSKNVISCECEGNYGVNVPLHRACLGEAGSLALLPLKSPTNWVVDPDKLKPTQPAVDQCQMHILQPKGLAETARPLNAARNDFGFTILPVPKRIPATPGIRFVDKEDLRKTNRTRVFNFTLNGESLGSSLFIDPDQDGDPQNGAASIPAVDPLKKGARLGTFILAGGDPTITVSQQVAAYVVILTNTLRSCSRIVNRRSVWKVLY